MTTETNSHVPFAQLSIEARVLFFIFSLPAMAFQRPWSPTPGEIGGDLERIWNAERLTPEDMRDGHRMTEILRTHLTEYALQGRRFGIPEAKARRGRQK